MTIIILESETLIELLDAVRYEHSPETPPTDIRITLTCLEIVNELLLLAGGDNSDLRGVVGESLIYLVQRARRVLTRAVNPHTPIRFRMVDTLGTVVIHID